MSKNGDTGIQTNCNIETPFQESPVDEMKDQEVDEDRNRFFESLFSFMKQRCTPISKIPMLGHKQLDLYTLYKEVVKRGGVDKVCRKKKITRSLQNGGFLSFWFKKNLKKNGVFFFELSNEFWSLLFVHSPFSFCFWKGAFDRKITISFCFFSLHFLFAMNKPFIFFSSLFLLGGEQ